ARDRSVSMLQHLRAVASITWRQEPIRFAFIIFALFSGGWTLVTPFIPVLIARVYEGTNLALAIGLIMGANGALAGIAAPVAGRLGDRLGTTRLITFNMLGLMLMSLLLVFAAAVVVYALAVGTSRVLARSRPAAPPAVSEVAPPGP